MCTSLDWNEWLAIELDHLSIMANIYLSFLNDFID